MIARVRAGLPTRAIVRGAVVAVVLLAVGVPLLRLAAELAGHLAALATVAEPLERKAALNTALLALGTTGFALAVGVPLGVLLGRADLPGAGRLRALATIPYIVPPYVSAIAWIALLNPTTGWLNAPLRALGLPTLDVYGLGGMVWVMGLEHAPLVLLATADALGRMDASLEEQARVAGARPWTVIARVTLPLAAPAILASASAVLASAAAAFGVPYLLASGAAAPSWVLTTRIAQHLDLDPSTGRPDAVALAVVLLALSSVIPALGYGWIARRSYATVGGKASRKAPLSLGRLRPVALGAVIGFVVVGAVVPLATLAMLSVTRDLGEPFGPGNLTLASYLEVLGRERDRMALLRSLWVAGGAATAAVAIGGLAAVLDAPRGDRTRRVAWLGWLVRLPYTIPGTVLALGMLLAWSQEIRLIVADRITFAFALADTGWLLLLAYAVKYAALPVGGIGAALASLDPALEEAARVSGAGWLATLRRVTLPLLAPSLVAGWFVVFLPAFTEVTMSVLLSGPKTRVVGVVLFELQTYGDPPAAAALAVVVAVVVLIGNALVAWLGSRAPAGTP